MGDLLNVLLLLRLGIYLMKRGAYFETRRSFNIPLLLLKSENVVGCLPLTSATLKMVCIVPNLISIQKRK